MFQGKQTASILKSIDLMLSRLGLIAPLQSTLNIYNLPQIILKNSDFSPVAIEKASVVVESSLLTLRIL